jgi:TRAP-type C4-dicarboxylate transport system substrate-binding protein
VSSDWFNGLPEDYQTALVEECRAAGQETSAVIAEAVAKAKAEVQENGMTVVEDVDLEAFRAAGEKAYEVLDLVEEKNKVHEEIGK